jgi:TPR repeat protein
MSTAFPREWIETQVGREFSWDDVEAKYEKARPELVRRFGTGPAVGGFESGARLHDTGHVEKAIPELEAAARAGEGRAMHVLAILSGRDGAQPAEGLRWLERAADLELAKAQASLAFLYLNRKTADDDVEALRWFRRAAAHESPEAQSSLGWMYANGRGVQRDDAEAVRWYRRSADQGLPEAQRALGRMYFEGLGVARDLRTAFEWSRRAAEQGDAEAQVMLARLYLSGEGTERDPKQAVRWASEAAGQDHVEGMAFLAGLLGFEETVERDAAAAAFWARKAAMRGHVVAQGLCVSLLVQAGQVAEGFAWLSLVAEGGDAKAVEAREQLDKVLTTAQRAEAAEILARLREELAAKDRP